jgi:hypothetical protein
VVATLVRSGSADAAGATLLRTLASPDPQSSAFFGDAVASGDLNADGSAEVVVGAWGDTVDGHLDEGRAYVFAGRDGSMMRSLTTPNPQDDAQFGHAVAVAAHGPTADVVVAAPGEMVAAESFGRVYVFSGQGGSLRRTLVSTNPLGGNGFGDALAAGDVDGDGVADIVVGASDEAVGHVYDVGQGRAYVFSGADGSLLLTLDIPEPQTFAHFGGSVAAADVNGDGRADVIVGAAYEDVAGNTEQGRAYVFSGRDGSLLYTLTTPNPQSNAWFGWSVAAADLNVDARADVIVGAWGETVDGAARGRVYAFSGADGSLLRTLSAADSSPDALFGWSVAAGRLSGGAPCVTVGAIGETAGGNAFQGRTYVFSGADGSRLYALSTPRPQVNAGFGAALAIADVNGDAASDLVIGANGESGGASELAGRAYVYSEVPPRVGGIATPPQLLVPPPSPGHHYQHAAIALAALAAIAAAFRWRLRRVVVRSPRSGSMNRHAAQRCSRPLVSLTPNARR